MSQRLVLVDDTSPDIQYYGPWFKVQNTQLDTDDLGPPFENTLHGVNVSANMSFSFSGAEVIVLGTTGITQSLHPPWECFIDNASIGPGIPPTDYPDNNVLLCEDRNLPDGPHVLWVQVTISNQQTFLFDQIQYLPSFNVSLDQSIVRIGSTDKAVQYSSGWQPVAGMNYTQTEGSSLTLDFSGVSVYLGGLIPKDFPLNNSSATYTIDDQPPITFVVPALPVTYATAVESLYNQILFQIWNLSTGNHTLVVTYQGNSGTAPLAINYFVVQDAPSPSTSSTGGGTTTRTASSTSGTTTRTASSTGGTTTRTATGSSSSVPMGTSSNSTSSQGSTSKKSPKAAIIGGVSGGLILLLLFMFLIRRRKNRKAQRLRPFTLPPSHSTPLHSHQTINSNLSQSRQLTGAPLTTSQVALTSSQMAGSKSVSVLAPTPLRNRPSAPPTTTDGVMTRSAREAEAALLESGPPEPRGNAIFLRHEDSGVRIASAEEDIIELPPLYTIG